MGASEHQLCAVITRDDEPMALFCEKLNESQQNSTAMELEFPGMAEVVKEFHGFLLGQDIATHMDHENLLCEAFSTECIVRWCLTCEECEPKLVY